VTHSPMSLDAAFRLMHADEARVAAESDAAFYAKILIDLRDTLIDVREAIADEGDRVYFGSTNDADRLKQMSDTLDGLAWGAIMARSQPKTDLYVRIGRLTEQLQRARAALQSLQSGAALALDSLTNQEGTVADFLAAIHATAARGQLETLDVENGKADAPATATPTSGYVDEISARDAAVAYRARIACDILEGFTDGIDGDRLGELARWTTSGRALDAAALLRAFAAPWIAAAEEAGWEGDPEAEARKDIDRHTLAARILGVNSFTPDQLAARFAEQNQLRAVQDAERKIRETGIAEEEEGDVVGVLLDLPDGSQIWTGDCSNDLRLQAMELEADPVTSGAFIIHAENKGRGLKGMTLLASAANAETAMGLARAYAAYVTRQQVLAQPSAEEVLS